MPYLVPIDSGDTPLVTTTTTQPEPETAPIWPAAQRPILEVYVKVLGWRHQYRSRGSRPKAQALVVAHVEDADDTEDSPLFHVRVQLRQHKFEYKTKWQWQRGGGGLVETLAQPLLPLLPLLLH